MSDKITQPSIPEYTPIGLSVFDFLVQRTAAYQDRPALNYYDRTVTFAALLQKINTTAAALKRMGIGRGDVVVVSLPAIPEAVYLFYAINKIGAVFCGMDCRITADEIKDIIDHVHPKVCFIADFHLQEFKNIDSTQVVCVSFAKSISFLAAFASFFADHFKGRSYLFAKKKNIISYSSFMSASASLPAVPALDITGEDVCAYFYTSGTTKGRKCVVLTNENINSAVLQYSYSQEDFKEQGRFCSIMPLFTCYGISLGTHLPLMLGMQVRLVPLFFGKNMKQLLLREKPGYIITVPAHWEHFMKEDFRGVDLSFLKGAIVGGDKLDENGENRLNEIFRSCNSNGKVMRGYGLTEASTAVTSQPPETPKGSVGCTMCWSEIAIFDPETRTRLAAGEKGEICVCGPNLCQGYLNDEEATAALLQIHEDGTRWLHSGDIGYLDENGFLYFCERIKRMYVRFDGTKISPYAIEQLMLKCPIIARCLIIAINDPKHFHGKCAKAFVVLKEGIDEADARPIVDKFIVANISPYMRPYEIEYVDRLPTTQNGKLDYFMQTK